MNTVNLKVLADYLEKLPADYPHFDMARFCNVYSDFNVAEEITPNQETLTHCGTSMCAVGHGPLAGLPALEREVDWVDYAARVFGGGVEQNYRPLEVWQGHNFQWCFGGLWDCYYPDVKHAVLRLRYMIEYNEAPPSYQATEDNHDRCAPFDYDWFKGELA